MREEPDPFEQGLWTIFAMFFGIICVYPDINFVEKTKSGIFFVILTTATLFWSYYQKVTKERINS